MVRIIKAGGKDWLETASRILSNGGLVAFPTETVYGLGADSFNEEAVIKVFKVKRRPLSDALIVHIADYGMLNGVVREFNEDAELLARRFWPGPLTIIMERDPNLPKVVTGGSGKVGVRWPAHPVAEELIKYFGKPLVAPSANTSGRPSPTTADDVASDLNDLIDLIIDGGETPIGIESTVIDLTVTPPRIVRPGAIPREEIERVLGVKVVVDPRALSKRKRYSPKYVLVLVEREGVGEDEYVGNVVRCARRVCGVNALIISCSENADIYKGLGFKVLVIGSRSSAFDVAKNLYRVLRRAEELGINCVVCEDFTGKGLWAAVRHRLRSAASIICR